MDIIFTNTGKVLGFQADSIDEGRQFRIYYQIDAQQKVCLSHDWISTDELNKLKLDRKLPIGSKVIVEVKHPVNEFINIMEFPIPGESL